MPNNFLNADISFPTFTADQTDGEKLDVVTNYLYMLLEQLRYTLGNLGAGNFNDAELEDIGKHIREPVYIELESVSGDVAKLEITTSGLTSTVQSQGGDISTLKQTANALSSTVQSQGGDISTLKQTANALSSTVQSQGGAISKLEQTASGLSITVYGNPEEPEDTGLNGKVINLSFTLDGLTVKDTEGTTLINGSSVYTKNLYAEKLIGEEVNLYDEKKNIRGYISIKDAQTADDAISITSEGAMALNTNEGNIFLGSAADVQLYAIEEIIVHGGDLRPSRDNYMDLGTLSSRWDDIYAANGTINTSDRQEKTDISYCLEQYDSLFDQLKPCSFRFLGRSRLHTGLISQDVQAAMEAEGVSDMDFAAFIKSTGSDGDHYGLRYTEFIALLIDQVQRLKSRVIGLEGKVLS